MNPKLIIASIAGIGALGGGATFCYYYFRKSTPEKQKATTKTVGTLTSQAPATRNPPSQTSSVSTNREVVTQRQESGGSVSPGAV